MEVRCGGRRRCRHARHTTTVAAAAAATTFDITATVRVDHRGRRQWSSAADLRIMAGAAGGGQHRSAKEAEPLLRATATARGSCRCQYSAGGSGGGVTAVDQTYNRISPTGLRRIR